MTKQELKNLISKASSKQKDTPWINDGALVDILSGIVDAIPEGGGGNEPLVVEGTYSTEDYKLILNNGQPSYNDIVAALNSGATVYVKAMSIEDEEEKLFTFAGIASSGWVYFTCVNFEWDHIALYDE